MLLLAPITSVTVTRADERIAGTHRPFEGQGLTEIDRARPRQFRGQHGRDEAGAQHAMRDPALERRRLGIGFVEMDGVVIARDLGEGLDIGDGDDTLVSFGHAYRQLVDRVTARRLIGHDRSSMGEMTQPHLNTSAGVIHKATKGYALRKPPRSPARPLRLPIRRPIKGNGVESDSAAPLREMWYYAGGGRRPCKPGKLLPKTMLGEPIVLGRKSDGQVFAAMRNICPHRGIPLSDGRFDGREIECCYHGWRFDRAGTCTAIPSLVAAAKAHRCRQDQGRRFIRRARCRAASGCSSATIRKPRPRFPSCPRSASASRN